MIEQTAVQITPDGGDALDQELARRLNGWCNGEFAHADSSAPSNPIIRQAAWWTCAAVVFWLLTIAFLV